MLGNQGDFNEKDRDIYIYMSLSLLFHILVITKWHTKEIIADGSRRSFNFQGELSRYRLTFKQLKDIHAGPESPTNPTSN